MQMLLALFKRGRPQINAVDFQQVERVEERLAVMLPAVQELEIRNAHRIADDYLAIDGRVLRQVRDQWLAVSPVVAVPGE